ncbi:MAG TPA: SIMPL domain-containing protein [Gammaproteobacteria bacterium]|jgi:hypothetical protein|nr:SIMPL domain-containing protein [Gammaproteobacteria bacterium]
MPKLIILLLFLILFSPFAVSADGLPQSPYIQVSGHGEVHAAPDMLIVSMTLEKTGMDAKAARADVEGRAAKVIALARKLGLADKDIRAPAVTVEPQYEWHNSSGGDGKQVLVGQHVSRGITLTLRDIARYGDLADGLFAAGVTRLDGVLPDTGERDKLQQEALGLAVGAAHTKALALAAAAGVSLGAAYSIAENGESRGPRPMFMAGASRASAEAAPEYLNGEIEIDADVQVYYLMGR